MNGFGGDGPPVREQVGAQLLVRLVDHVAHAAVGIQARAVTLTRSGGADPVEVGARGCGRGGAGGQSGQRHAGHQNGQPQTTNHDEFPPTMPAAGARYRYRVTG